MPTIVPMEVFPHFSTASKSTGSRRAQRRQRQREELSEESSDEEAEREREEEGDSDSAESGSYHFGQYSETGDSSQMDDLMFALKTGIPYSQGANNDEEPLIQSLPPRKPMDQYRLRRISIADTHL